MTQIRQVGLDALLEIRERVLTPGHPDRPVVWEYDTGARHFGMYDDEWLVGCASLTEEQPPYRETAKAFHLHSMAVEPSYQGQGLGRLLLDQVVSTVQTDGGDLVWATARPSAVGFYERHGFGIVKALQIQPTGALMYYMERAVP